MAHQRPVTAAGRYSTAFATWRRAEPVREANGSACVQVDSLRNSADDGEVGAAGELEEIPKAVNQLRRRIGQEDRESSVQEDGVLILGMHVRTDTMAAGRMIGGNPRGLRRIQISCFFRQGAYGNCD